MSDVVGNVQFAVCHRDLKLVLVFSTYFVMICFISWKVYVKKKTSYADDNSLTAIDHDINVIKTDLER